MGASEFGILSLGRRVVFWATALSSLDMAVALTRHLGLSTTDARRRREYLVAALSIVAACTTVMVVLGWIFAEPLGRWLFGGSHQRAVLQACLLMMAGHGCYHLLYSYYRGTHQMGRANLLQFVLLGVGGLAVAWFYASRGAVFVLTATGFIFMSAGIVLVGITLGSRQASLTFGGVRGATTELAKYGGPRVFAGFGYQGLLAIGPLIASFSSLADVAYLAVAQLLFMVLETGFGSFGLVALPRVAQLTGSQGGTVQLRAGVMDAVVFTTQIGLFGTVQAFIWCGVLVQLWLGTEFQPVAPLLRILLLALVPYVAYTILKAIIDGIEPRPVNAANLLISLGVACVFGFGLVFLGFGASAGAVGMTAGIWCLGLLTVGYLVTRFGLSLDRRMLWTTLLANAVLGTIGAAAHYAALQSIHSPLWQSAMALTLSGVLAIVYLAWLNFSGVDWLQRLRSRIRVAENG